MSEKILVTGGGGLLGYALRQELPEAYYATRRDANLTDLKQTRALFEKNRPSKVIHLAALVGGVKSNAARNADMLTENLQINSNVLSVAQELGVERLISVVSSCAFATYPDKSSTEEDLHVGLPYEGNMGYGCSKRILDIQTKLYAKQYGRHFSTIAPVTMYGPNDNWSLEDGHVVAALIHKCVLAKEKNKALEVWGSGSAVRQFVYSGDIARVLVQSLKAPWKSAETVIVAPDKGLTIRDLVLSVAQAVGFKGEIVFDKSKPEGQLVKVIESVRFAKAFPNFSFTPLADGLKQTAQWFVENQKKFEVAA